MLYLLLKLITVSMNMRKESIGQSFVLLFYIVDVFFKFVDNEYLTRSYNHKNVFESEIMMTILNILISMPQCLMLNNDD